LIDCSTVFAVLPIRKPRIPTRPMVPIITVSMALQFSYSGISVFGKPFFSRRRNEGAYIRQL
jgi:hypothetical protein